MGLRIRLRLPHKSSPRTPSHLLLCVDDFVAQTKTLAGHNLEPTPWHIFPRKSFSEATTYRILQCSYFSCPHNSVPDPNTTPRRIPGRVVIEPSNNSNALTFSARWIHRDLEPWAKTGVTKDHVEKAKQNAAFRVVILSGKLYVDLYYACVQSRMMFTVWGILQLLSKYPGWFLTST
ncbi:hypothetical protein Rs2_00810 [Raphanus sativus]|nr:hypothetical protein Rs2_00810 [Raphanus sativus]